MRRKDLSLLKSIAAVVSVDVVVLAVALAVDLDSDLGYSQVADSVDAAILEVGVVGLAATVASVVSLDGVASMVN